MESSNHVNILKALSYLTA